MGLAATSHGGRVTSCNKCTLRRYWRSLRPSIKVELIPRFQEPCSSYREFKFPNPKLVLLYEMSQVLAVFGATGNQGSSVIRHVLGDSELSAIYKIRAVTRDISTAKAKLPSTGGIEIVAADLDDQSSLITALQGAHAVFALTTTNYAGPGGHSEIDQGRNLVDAAISTKVEFLVWSTLPSPTSLSNGKYKKVTSFDAKASIEEYIRSKNVKSAFYSPGSFMQNFATFTRPQPDQQNKGSYVIYGVVAPSTKLPLVDIAEDTGKFVAAILASPSAFEGKTICGASKLCTMDDQAQLIGNATGKPVRYQQLPADVFKSFLPPHNADELVEMSLYQEEYGYYGADTEELVERSVSEARTKPLDLREFLERNPLVLE